MKTISYSSKLINGIILNENQKLLAKYLFVNNEEVFALFPNNILEIFTLTKNNYGQITKALKECPEKFDKILLSIHFFQNKRMNKSQRKKIIEFLTIAYFFTSDIRYFNELLFFLRDEHEDYFSLCVDKFHSSLESSIYHIFPRSNRIEACEILKKYRNFNILNSDFQNKIKKVALYGHPKGFDQLGEKLNELGYDCYNIHLPNFNSKSSTAYKRGYITRFAFSSKILYYFFTKLKKNSFKSTIIHEKPNSTTLGNKIKVYNFDIALHRLYGIIRSNLYSNSGLGILNDHVGFLPFFRGWSTIEYAILFGFPLASTVHFVDNGVDTGNIIKVFPFKFTNSTNTLNDIINQICGNNYDRILEVIENLNRSDIEFHSNDIKKGYQFFRMHDVLKAYVEKICNDKKVFNFIE